MNRPSALAALLIAAAFAAFAAGCRSESTARADNQPAGPKRVGVLVAVATERTLVRQAEVQGALYAKEDTTIASEVSGPVTRVVKDFGDSADAGQPLLEIDSREYKFRAGSADAALNQALARLAAARADYQRASQLHAENMMSTAQFDQLQATMKVAEADAESNEKAEGLAQKKLGDTTVRAPFKGFVQKRFVSLGQFVNPGDKLFDFIAIDPMKLRVPVPERYVPMAKLGLEIQMTLDADPDRLYPGKVTRIAPALDEQSRTLLVEAEVPNPDGTLKPGYFAHVQVSLGKDRGLFIPQTAVVRYAGVERVFVIKDGIAHSREVTTGSMLGDQVEVMKGLKEGEQVAASGTDRLAEGMPVEPEKQS